MNTERLLFDHYHGVVDSPEAFSKLRSFILEFAVRGSLVKQILNDEPASELLESLHRQRGKLIIEGKVEKVRNCYQIVPNELPYELPPIWR